MIRGEMLWDGVSEVVMVMMIADVRCKIAGPRQSMSAHGNCQPTEINAAVVTRLATVLFPPQVGYILEAAMPNTFSILKIVDGPLGRMAPVI